MNLRPSDLARIRAALSLIEDETEGDEKARQDTIEMLTDAMDLADAILSRNAQTRAFKDALALQIASLKKRQTRYVRRDEREREALGIILASAGLRNMERPSATLTLAKGEEVLQLAADFECPTDFLKPAPPPPPREPDTDALLRCVKAGVTIAGAAIGRAPDRLSIRRA